VKTGTPAGSPTPPALVQSDGSIWEIPLARVAVANGFVSITAAEITNVREYANYDYLSNYGHAGLPGGRITLTSATPVTVSDVTAAATLYYTPYSGNLIRLYNNLSGDWVSYEFAETSLAVPNTTNTNYDLVAYDQNGTFTLEAVAWASATARSTALVLQDGVWVLSGATNKRLLGSFRTTGVAGQTEDSAKRRFVCNLYHTLPRPLVCAETTASWSYGADAWRAANNATAVGTSRIEILNCLNVYPVQLHVTASLNSDGTGGKEGGAVGVALDATNVNNARLWNFSNSANNAYGNVWAYYNDFTGTGYHYLQWVERRIQVFFNNATVFYAGTYDIKSGMSGIYWG